MCQLRRLISLGSLSRCRDQSKAVHLGEGQMVLETEDSAERPVGAFLTVELDNLKATTKMAEVDF